MTEQMNKEKFKQAIDHTLSGLTGDPFLYQRVAANAEKGDKKVRYHFPKSAVIALIALLCMGTVAVAAGVYGGTINWLGEVVPDENMPAVMPTMAPVMETAEMDLNEDVLDQLWKDGTKLVVWQQMPDGTLLPEVSTRMMRTADSEASFLALLAGNDELVLPRFIPDGYEFVRGEVYYECRAGGEWRCVERQTLESMFVAELYTLDHADEIISGYHLMYRESPEDYHYLSVDVSLLERQNVEEQTFGFLPGQTPCVVQVPGMDYALAITAEKCCSLSMLRDLKQPIDYLWFPESETLGEMAFEQLDVIASAPLLDVDTLIRMFASE